MDMLSKSDFRKSLLTKRRQINPHERQAAGANAAEVFSETDSFKKSTHIACYYPIKDEFDCLPIIEKIWAANKNCYLPCLVENTLSFVLYQQHDKLQPNQYRILEPVTHKKIALEELDIVICPLVGFDSKGNRLGMGAGYYDRTFEKIRQQKIKKCYLNGLAYEMQYVSALPKDSWDVMLDSVITEKRVIVF